MNLLRNVLFIAGGFCCIVLFIAVVPPYKRGFHCHDHTIRLPFKPNTISVPMLMLICHGLPSLIVLIYEYFIINSDNQPFKVRMKYLFFITTAVNMEFTIGLYIQLIIVFLLKSTTGVLRPHFIEVCRPNFETLDCGITNEGYIAEFQCTAEVTPQLKYARESFPSGHASSCTYALCFLLFYMYNRRTRLQERINKLSISILLCFASWTVYVYITRVTDHWHHASDIYGGITIGACVALFMFCRKTCALLKNFKE